MKGNNSNVPEMDCIVASWSFPIIRRDRQHHTPSLLPDFSTTWSSEMMVVQNGGVRQVFSTQQISKYRYSSLSKFAFRRNRSAASPALESFKRREKQIFLSDKSCVFSDKQGFEPSVQNLQTFSGRLKSLDLTCQTGDFVPNNVILLPRWNSQGDY